MLQEAKFYEKSGDNDKTVQCRLCSRYCKIPNKSFGFCKSRKNINGELFLYNYPKIASYHKDPIEKKPLYHFIPGSDTFSIGGFGCNFSCLNCQNYMLARNSYEFNNSTKILPETIVKTALSMNCRSISWTYNEPTMYFEFAEETARIAQQNNIKNIYVSNGYMSEESLHETLKFIDAFNIDLKSMNDEFYHEICGGKLDFVLDNLKTIYNEKNKNKNRKNPDNIQNNNHPHLEITTLLIDDLNTSKDEIESICNFIYYELGSEVPVHFSRFFPMYKLSHKNPTDLKILDLAKEIAIGIGLEYVYLGNVQTDNNSYCPECHELLVSREGFYTSTTQNIKDGHCLNCGHKLNFVLE